MQEKMAPIDVHGCLLNVYRDQAVDANKAGQWVVHFSSGNSNVKDKTWIFASMVCRLLFVIRENTWIKVVTVLKKMCLVAEIWLYQTVLLSSLCLLWFPWK